MGTVLAGEVERGKDSVQLGLVFKLLDEMGFALKVDFPESALPMLRQLQEQGVRPLSPPSSRGLRFSYSSFRITAAEGKNYNTITSPGLNPGFSSSNPNPVVAATARLRQ